MASSNNKQSTKKYYKLPIGKAKIVNKGKSLTIVSNSIMTVEAIKVFQY